MRIVHVITRFLKAGAEENTLLSCNGQVEAGHEVHLIYGRDVLPEMCKQLHPDIKQHQIPFLIRNIHPIKDTQALFATYKLLKTIQPDIVHTHTSKAGIVGRVAAKIAGVPCIIHGVHMLAFSQVSFLQKWVYLTLEKVAAPMTDAFINVSPGTMEENLRYHIGRQDNHYFIPSGMDIRKFQQPTKPEFWKDILDAPEIVITNPRFILYVGSFEPRKRHLAFLDAFKQVAEQVPEAVLLLLGQGEMEAAIRQKIEALNLQGRVIVVGFRDDVEQFMAMADVGVLASAREGLARVLIQYVLTGLPVIATYTPGCELLIEHEKNGFLVPVDKPEQMATPIIQLLQDEPLRQSMAGACRAKDLSAWDASHMVAEIEKIYREYNPSSRTSGK